MTRGSSQCLVWRHLLIAALLFGGAAWADDATCERQEGAGLSTLRSPYKPSLVLTQLAPLCYGVKGEATQPTLDVRALLEQQDATTHDLAQALQQLAKYVAEHADVFQSDAARTEVLQALNEAAKQMEAGQAPGHEAVTPVRWKFGRWESLPTVPDLTLSSSLDNACHDDMTKQQCVNALRSFKAWTRIAQLAESTLTSYSAAALKEVSRRSAMRIAQWHAYRDEGLPQFQWEWAVNSWRLSRNDSRQRDERGQPIGPRTVPNDQLIFLHPGVGVEWRDAVKDGSKAQTGVYLEALGINRWSWDDATGQMRGGSGISIVSTYAKRDNATDVGYGLMLHWKGARSLALAITKSGGETRFMLNIDLAEYVKEKLSYWQGVEKQIQDVGKVTP